MSFEAFRFLELPAQLRCMVYEDLKIETRRHVLKMSEALECKHWTVADGAHGSITLVRKLLAVAILATCWQVQCEVVEYLRSRLRDLKRDPVRFILGYGGAAVLSDHCGPFAECFNDPVSPSLSTYIREITNRRSSFFEYARSLAFEPHDKLIVTGEAQSCTKKNASRPCAAHGRLAQ
ncbi:hypothetical protein HBH53_041170 [Parastagonospora nodorum]|nr:hypothetical protein HBH53_041170 [Parastagonospora nodorum]KAH5165166.1 hypothetical protein HBI73_041070 [Parastagonospora nodorum]KAH5656463.1 hypothetical protein HBI23_147040 [Parastagonospora nodorum]KAH6273799.1 hypothetical protein HBI41_074200 [Parastagonospora nodorum]KAH6294317.1 hypothetical protein HBI40_065310 [Parastagonospora nodorum]